MHFYLTQWLNLDELTKTQNGLFQTITCQSKVVLSFTFINQHITLFLHLNYAV